MLDDGYEVILNSFTEELNRAFRAAGPPTYSTLQQVSEHLRARGGADRVDVLSRSNTHEILHGRRPQPPKWHWVRSYVTVLRAIAATNGIPADSIGTTDEWKGKYDAVRAAADQAARRPATVGRHRKHSQRENTDWGAPALGTLPPAAGGHQAGAQESAVQESAVREDAGDSEVLGWIRQPGPPQRWLMYRDIAPESRYLYICLESRANVVRTYEPRLIPGLLQAEAYTRAVLAQYYPAATGAELTTLVELFMSRQELLAKPRFRLWAVLEEAALRNQLAGKQAMRSQITHLINMAEQPNVTLQVLLPPQRRRLDDHVMIKEPITHFRFPDEHRDDVVFLDRPPDGVILTDRREIAHYSQLMSRLGMRAAGSGDARDHLRRVFMELLRLAWKQGGEVRDEC